jgi:hypothetical protein
MRFCVIRSYLETLRRQGHHLMDTLVLLHFNFLVNVLPKSA